MLFQWFSYMTDKIYFNSFESTLKSMSPITSDERYFEGLLTVQMKDKQGEITIVDELYKVLPVWMDRGAPISDTHSNRIIGKGINFSKTTAKNKDGDELPAIKITGKIFKNYELDNVIWDKIKKKEYRGLSFGGATRTNRVPTVMKDGSIAYALKDLEHYEVAVCKDPAVPMALITDVNAIAKAEHNGVERGDGKMVIQCTKLGCFVEKSSTNTPSDGHLGSTMGGKPFKHPKHNPYDPEHNELELDLEAQHMRKSEEDKEKKPLNKPMRDDGDKKFKVYVKDPSTGNIVTVRFGDPNMEIKRDDPERRSSFRARHDCDNAKDITSAQYWSCKMWEKETSVSEYTSKNIEDIAKADLGKYDSFQGKVNALVKEGYPEENAKKIVGAFVKGEKKASEGGSVGDGTLSTETDGVSNAVHNNKDDEEEKRKKEERDHSNSDGDSHSMYNQDVGKSELPSGGGYFGGIRENIEGTIKQGGLREEETNEIKREDGEEKEDDKEKKDLERAEKGGRVDLYIPKRGHKVEEDPDIGETSVQDGRPDEKPMKQVKQSLAEAIKRQGMILEINKLNSILHASKA